MPPTGTKSPPVADPLVTPENPFVLWLMTIETSKLPKDIYILDRGWGGGARAETVAPGQ